MDTTKRNKNGLLLIAGALAGAAATYYLQTPAGKKLRKDISKKTNKFANDTTEKAKTLANDVKAKSQDALDLASTKMSEIKETFQEKSNAALASASDKISDLKVGASKAQQAIENGMKS